MDAKLLSDYQAAVRARVIVERLPPGLREYAQQYEALCLADLRAQAGREVTEAELMATAKPTILSVLQDLWPVLSPILLAAVKKYGPTIAASSAMGATVWSLIAPYLGNLAK